MTRVRSSAEARVSSLITQHTAALESLMRSSEREMDAVRAAAEGEVGAYKDAKDAELRAVKAAAEEQVASLVRDREAGLTAAAEAAAIASVMAAKDKADALAALSASSAKETTEALAALTARKDAEAAAAAADAEVAAAAAVIAAAAASGVEALVVHHASSAGGTPEDVTIRVPRTVAEAAEVQITASFSELCRALGREAGRANAALVTAQDTCTSLQAQLSSLKSKLEGSLAEVATLGVELARVREAQVSQKLQPLEVAHQQDFNLGFNTHVHSFSLPLLLHVMFLFFPRVGSRVTLLVGSRVLYTFNSRPRRRHPRRHWRQSAMGGWRSLTRVTSSYACCSVKRGQRRRNCWVRAAFPQP